MGLSSLSRTDLGCNYSLQMDSELKALSQDMYSVHAHACSRQESDAIPRIARRTPDKDLTVR